MIRDVPNFKKSRTELRTEPNRTRNGRTQNEPNPGFSAEPNYCLEPNRTSQFQLNSNQSHNTAIFWYYCIHNNDIYRPLSSGFNLPNVKINYILDSPKLVVITELQIYCNYRYFDKKIKLLRKLIENKRKKDKKKTFKG